MSSSSSPESHNSAKPAADTADGMHTVTLTPDVASDQARLAAEFSNFFRRPQELHDMVYDLLYQELQGELHHLDCHSLLYALPREDPFDTVYVTTRTPMPHLRLVNKKMKEEYDHAYASANRRLEISLNDW